jgi:hypothetical protein
MLQILKDERMVNSMSIKIYEPEYYDPDYDNCGKDIKAILQIDTIKIPLCEDCLDDLNEAIIDYQFSKF